MSNLDDLDDLAARLLKAHASQDRAALVTLYQEAAHAANGRDDTDAAGFYLTHAYVFALELGHTDTSALHSRLKAMGREE